MCGLYDVSVARFGRVNNSITLADNFGEQKEIFDGVDVSLSARLPRGIVVQGGTSTGRVKTDNCFVIDSPQALLNCDVTPPFQTQVKLLGVYPLPFWGIQTSATFQSLPGPQITATYVARNAEILPSLGRNLSSGANGTASVPLIKPGTLYGDRLNQLDFRLSKIFRFGTRRVQANMDLYNMLNGAAVLAQNNNFGAAWLMPNQVLQGRLVRFSGQFDF